MSDKLEVWRKRERRQAALDLREVSKTAAGKRVLARLLLKAGTYAPVRNKRDAARRDVGLALERDILRACGERIWQQIQHLRFADFSGPVAEVVHPTGDSDAS